MFHIDWIRFLWFWLRGSCIYSIFVRGVVLMEVSSCVNWDVYSFNSASCLASVLGLSLLHGGSETSGSTCSDIIFLVVILFVVWVSAFAQKCKFLSSSMSSMVLSRCPTYPLLLNVMCLLLKFDTRMLTDVLPLMLWMQFTMFILGPFPFVDSWLLMKYAVCPVIEWPLVLMGQYHYVWEVSQMLM